MLQQYRQMLPNTVAIPFYSLYTYGNRIYNHSGSCFSEAGEFSSASHQDTSGAKRTPRQGAMHGLVKRQAAYCQLISGKYRYYKDLDIRNIYGGHTPVLTKVYVYTMACVSMLQNRQ